MLSTDLPLRFPIRFGEDATSTYNNYPLPQTAPTPTPTSAPASLQLGFPPETYGTGAIPPGGADVTGILYQITDWCRWQASGGASFYDGTFATAIGGYPKYSTLASTTPGILWQSSAESNTTDPDGGSPAGWISVKATEATVSEINAGAVTGKYISPGNLATAMGAAASESMTFPNGKIMKSGIITGSAIYTVANAYSISFGTAFPNAIISAQLTPWKFNAQSQRSSFFQISSLSLASIFFFAQGTETGSPQPIDGVSWTAWGW